MIEAGPCCARSSPGDRVARSSADEPQNGAHEVAAHAGMPRMPSRPGHQISPGRRPSGRVLVSQAQQRSSPSGGNASTRVQDLSQHPHSTAAV